MILDATTKSLEIILAGAITTNQLPWTATYADITTTAFTPTASDGASNSTTAVAMVAAPAASTQRQIKEVSIYNADTVAATVTVRYNDNGTFRTIVKVVLQTGEHLQYSDFFGWRVLDATGAAKSSSAVSGFTAGSIPFGSSIGGLTQDNTNLFFDDANNRFGLGFPIPAVQMDINDVGVAGPTPLFTTGVRVVGSGFMVLEGSSPLLFARRTNGSFASPTALLSAQNIFFFGGRAHNGTAYSGTQISMVMQASENWSSTAEGTQFKFSTTPNGSVTGNTNPALFLENDNRVGIDGALYDTGRSFQAPVAAATITIANNVGRLILNPAGLLATLTINMPASPKDGQICRISSTQAITTLTQNGNGNTLQGGLATLAVSGFGEWTYVTSATTWFRTG